MKSLRTIVLVASAMCGAASYSEAATISAASCSLAAVQAAVNAAVDGDKVVIPDGSCAWTGGIKTTKQIRIEAQNYTPTSRGTMTRSVTITNNSTSSPLFEFTSGNNYHVGLSGIRFNEGSGNQNHVRVQGTGSKVPLINDCAFEIKNRFGNNPDATAIAWLSQGGVMWNASILGVGGGSAGNAARKAELSRSCRLAHGIRLLQWGRLIRMARLTSISRTALSRIPGQLLTWMTTVGL